MELQHRGSVCVNEYEESEGIQKRDDVRTEDIYHCLQKPSEAYRSNRNMTVMPERNWKKCVFLMFAGNVLILTIILVIVGMSYSLHKETHLMVANGQEAKNEEKWLLQDNVFYLFWHEYRDCKAAVRFCAKRNANLVTLTSKNKIWLQSKAKGKHFLVLSTTSDGSGQTSSDMDVFGDDEDDYRCVIMTPDTDTDHRKGFVCEWKAMRPPVY